MNIKGALEAIVQCSSFWASRESVTEHSIVVEDDGRHYNVRVLDRAGKIAHAALAALQSVPDGGEVRPEVATFALLMEKELRANDHKRGWKEDTAIDLASRVQEEAKELFEAAYALKFPDLGKIYPAPTAATIAEEAADVANMAMMVADVCGCLAAPPPDGSPPQEDAITRLRRLLKLCRAYIHATALRAMIDAELARGPDPTCGFRIREVPRQPFVFEDDDTTHAPTEALHAGAEEQEMARQLHDRLLGHKEWMDYVPGSIFSHEERAFLVRALGALTASPSPPVAPQGEPT